MFGANSASNEDNQSQFSGIGGLDPSVKLMTKIPDQSIPQPINLSTNPIGLEAVMAARASNPFVWGEFPNAGRHAHSLQTPFTENCLFKGCINGMMGAGLGVVWGIFMTSMGTGVNSYNVMPGSPGYIDPTHLSTKEQMKLTARDMLKQSKSSAKSFGTIGAIYTVTECTIEKTRGKHDLTNALAAGCLTGGALAVRGGPQATAIGCAGFAAFGYVIDKFMQ